MKKITIMAALLGSAYFANAQVGIGTTTPITSSYLDVTAKDKGVLIPRVSLTSTSVFLPVTGDEAESLLVYNTATAGSGATAVTPGFYYWIIEKDAVAAHWERIANATDLANVVSTIDSNVDKIKDLLKTAFPSNNLGDENVNGGVQGNGANSGGGMVYTPGTPANGSTPAVPPKIDYVYYDASANNGKGAYVKQDITKDILDLISAQESKTVLVKSTKGTQQYYISEAYLVANSGVLPTQTVIDGWGTTPAAGVFLIDVVGGVINNIEQIFTSTPTNPITIVEGGVTHNFNTVQEYIEYISTNSDLAQGTVTAVVDPTSGDVTFSIANGDGTSTAVPATAFDAIVKANETNTVFTAVNDANGKIVSYKYFSEKDIQALITAGTITGPEAITPANAGSLAGGTAMNIPAAVANNFETILDQSTTIVKPGTTDQYYTVEQIIQQIATNTEGVMTFVPGTGATAAEQLASSSFTYVDASGVTQTITFDALVKANETVTTLEREETGTAAAGNVKVTYDYLNEAKATSTIDVQADLKSIIEGNSEIKNAISNILNAGGNVYFGNHDNNTATADVLYTETIAADGTVTKTPIDIASTLINNTTIIEAAPGANLTPEEIAQNTIIQQNINNLKNNLGDTINAGGSTSVFTGDTYVDGATTYYIYKGEFTTTVTGTTANTSGVTLDKDAAQILSTTLRYGTGMTASITNLTLNGKILGFKIGVGNMYNVLDENDITAKVIIEFASAVKPAGL